MQGVQLRVRRAELDSSGLGAWVYGAPLGKHCCYHHLSLFGAVGILDCYSDVRRVVYTDDKRQLCFAYYLHLCEILGTEHRKRVSTSKGGRVEHQQSCVYNQRDSQCGRAKNRARSSVNMENTNRQLLKLTFTVSLLLLLHKWNGKKAKRTADN